MQGTLKKKVIVGVLALAALAGGGGAIAATQLGSAADEQAILSDAAERLGVEPAELTDALEQAYEARIDAALAAGELTKERADAMKQRLQDGDFPLVGGPFLHGHGFPGHHIMGGLDAAATYLGLTEAELRDGLESGKTLAELATGAGKTVDGLKQALTADAKTHLDEAVKDGKLTEAQKQEILTRLADRIDDLVNGRGPGPLGHRFGGPGHHEGPMMESATAA